MPATRFGWQCRLYYNAGTYASPTWTLLDRVQDAELTCEDDEVEETSRQDGGVKTWDQGLRMIAYEFDMRVDQADADYMILLNAYLNRTPLEVLMINGAESFASAMGWRSYVKVFKGGRGEGIGDRLKTRFRLLPTPNLVAPSHYADTGTTTTTTA